MKEYSFTVTEQEANMILTALHQLPYGQVVQLIAKIHQQAQEPVLVQAPA